MSESNHIAGSQNEEAEYQDDRGKDDGPARGYHGTYNCCRIIGVFNYFLLETGDEVNCVIDCDTKRDRRYQRGGGAKIDPNDTHEAKCEQDR